jgi:hypothetical protein
MHFEIIGEITECSQTHNKATLGRGYKRGSVVLTVDNSTSSALSAVETSFRISLVPFVSLVVETVRA